MYLFWVLRLYFKIGGMLKDERMPRAFNSVLLIYYAPVQRDYVVIACHQNVFNVSDQESIGDLNIWST